MTGCFQESVGLISDCECHSYIIFLPSTISLSLPRWLRMVHPSFYEDAYLYGTPPRSLLSSDSKSPVVRLCIIAIHKEIYASVSK